MKKSMVLALLCLFASGILAGCNTTRGFAQDLQKVGEEMEGAAEETGGTEPR